MSKKVGRPPVIDDRVVSILVTSFHDGLNVQEACWQSGISRETYYQNIKKDLKFADTMGRAQASVGIQAKKVIINAVAAGDLSTAKWWLDKCLRKGSAFQAVEDNGPILYKELRERIQSVIDITETQIRDKYKKHLFMERKNIIESGESRVNRAFKEMRIKEINDLLKLPTPELIDYLQLEVSATGIDIADVGFWLASRQGNKEYLEKIDNGSITFNRP